MNRFLILYTSNRFLACCISRPKKARWKQFQSISLCYLGVQWWGGWLSHPSPKKTDQLLFLLFSELLILGTQTREVPWKRSKQTWLELKPARVIHIFQSDRWFIEKWKNDRKCRCILPSIEGVNAGGDGLRKGVFPTISDWTLQQDGASTHLKRLLCHHKPKIWNHDLVRPLHFTAYNLTRF